MRTVSRESGMDNESVTANDDNTLSLENRLDYFGYMCNWICGRKEK
jgi:hypothetical protein